MNVTKILANPLSQRLLASAIPARFAYTALDGDPPRGDACAHRCGLSPQA